jgi:hypothetical protein
MEEIKAHLLDKTPVTNWAIYLLLLGVVIDIVRIVF